MKYFTTCKTQNEVKETYRNLAKQFHPDLNNYDTTAIMQEINKEYAFAVVNIAKGANLSTEETEAAILNAEAYRNAVNAVTNLKGIVVELCGAWLWVSGNTYPVKDTLKAAGFYFASAKKMWYFHTDEYTSNNRKKHTIEEIRTKYGSKLIANKKSSFAIGA